MSRRLAELTASIRAERSRWRHPLLLRTEQTRGLQRRPGGRATLRPGDRLHRALNGSSRAGDLAYLGAVIGAVVDHKGDVAGAAAQLGVGVRTLRRWMGVHVRIRAVVEHASRFAHFAHLCKRVTPLS